MIALTMNIGEALELRGHDAPTGTADAGPTVRRRQSRRPLPDSSPSSRQRENARITAGQKPIGPAMIGARRTIA
ncbi:hypothetical protein ABTM14_19680, partial [Acinetobacter baumannii]